MASTTERVRAADGTDLLVRHWASQSTQPWATVFIVHGIAEHSGRYEHVGDRLAAVGAEVVGSDLRGFGASGGPRASLDRWSQLHDDLAELLDAARASAPDCPIAVYAHSMGGLIALGYALSDRPPPDAYVLSAPAIEASIPAWQRLGVRTLSVIAPRATVPNRIDGSVLSRDPSVGERYIADPLTVHATTARFARLAFAEQERVIAALDRLDVPTLVVHGGDDRLVPTASSERFERLPVVTRRVVPDLRHEVHNEPEGLEVIDEIAAWLRSKLVSGA
jgi:alpha-beta hydrolase superfamily lysophospholipase